MLETCYDDRSTIGRSNKERINNIADDLQREESNMKKINFRKGNGEFIGAAISVPLLIILILLVVNIFQISRCEQRLIYASYFCGRSAAVSFDLDAAKDSVSNVCNELNSEGDEIKCELQVSGNWIKGNFVVITVSQDLNPVLGIGRGQHTRRIAMMIEHSRWIEEH